MSSASMPLLKDDTVAFGDDLDVEAKTNSLTHPYVTFFHLAFRGAAIVMYMLCDLMFNIGFVASFVTVVLLISMDFWTVKNITGRLMVGLRWWNYIDEDGKSHWVFESRKGESQNRINERESRIFWTTLFLTPLLWSLFFIIALFRLEPEWMLLIAIALILNCSNLYGYIRCKVGNKQSLSTVTGDFFRKQVFQNAMSVISRQASNPQPNPSSQSMSNTV